MNRLAGEFNPDLCTGFIYIHRAASANARTFTFARRADFFTEAIHRVCQTMAAVSSVQTLMETGKFHQAAEEVWFCNLATAQCDNTKSRADKQVMKLDLMAIGISSKLTMSVAKTRPVEWLKDALFFRRYFLNTGNN